MQRRILVISFIALLLAAAGATLRYGQLPSAQERTPVVDFALIDGSRVDIDELRGQPVLVHFWATTCRECRREIPQLRALYHELHPRGLELIAVAMPYDPPNRVLELAENAPLPYPVALDIDATAVQAFGNVSLTPTTFLISPEGRIVHHHTGKLDFAALRKKITDLLDSVKS